MVQIIEADASHEEAIQAKDEEMETEEETLEEPNPEPEKAEKSIDRQPTAKEFKAVDGARKAFEVENKKLKAEKEELARRAAQPATGDVLESVRLGKALAEHSEEETEIIVTYAKGKFNNLRPTPEQIIQASHDPWVMGAIESTREKVRSENKTPAPSSPASLVGGKSAEDLSKMDTKDFAKFARESMKGGRSGI